MPKHSKWRSRLYTAFRFLSIFFAIALIISIAGTIYFWYSDRKDEQAFQELAQMVGIPTTGTVQSGTNKADLELNPDESKPDESQSGVEGSDAVQILEKYRELYAMNPDLYGWLSLDGTALDYPVMFTPNDPEYYLRRAFDGTYSRNGVPFVGEGYEPGCGHHILYGHNMTNGSMFAPLLSYGSEDFWKEHPTIQFDTLYQEGEYEIVSAFYSRVFSPWETNVFRYYYYTDLSVEAVFDEYVSNVLKLSRYDTGVVPEYGDELITLITCSYGTSTERFAVVACKKS